MFIFGIRFIIKIYGYNFDDLLIFVEFSPSSSCLLFFWVLYFGCSLWFRFVWVSLQFSWVPFCFWIDHQNKQHFYQPTTNQIGTTGTKNLLKWKGVMFGIDEPDNTMANVNAQTPLSNDTTLTTSSEPDSSCATMIEINQIATDNAKDINAVDDKDQEVCSHRSLSLFSFKRLINISQMSLLSDNYG